MSNTTTPRTFAEVMELVSALRSRRSVYSTCITYLKTGFKDTDAGRAEMRVTREDLGIVSQSHLEMSIIEMEQRIDLIDAELEELQNQPMGGGTPPAALLSAPKKEDAAIAEAAKASAAAAKKGTPSGKPRASGSGPS